MALAVCLLFDGRSERRVRQLWARLEEIGVSTLATHTHGVHHPHLSYAVLRQWDLEAVTKAVAALPSLGPVRVSCHGTLVFPRGRVALAPALPAAVLRRQEQVVEAVEAAGAELHRHYRPGRWVPHVSVATRARHDVLADAVAAVADTVPMELTADRAALVDSATGAWWPLPNVP